MRKLTCVAVAAVLLSQTFVCEAKLTVPTIDDLPVLSLQNAQKTACSRTANYFLRAHYKPVELNKDFADDIIDQYLSFLDYNKSLYTKDEVSKIYKNSDKILDAVSKCDLSYPLSLYSDNLKRRFLKYSFFVDYVKNPVDVSGKEQVEIDRRKSPYFSSQEDIRKQWVAEVKNEYINQVLNDKTDEKARERIKRRYEAALGRLAQTTSEDAFSTFENAFATAIDPHTSYLSPEDSESFNDDINLSLEGIGAVLSSEDEFTVINSLIPGSPAELSKKLKPKDKIVGVRQEDGSYEDIIGWRLTDVVKKVKGKKGTKVTLEIERGEGAGAKTFSVDLVRDKIKLQERAAKGEVKIVDGNKVGVISIKSFYTDLNKDLKKEIAKLKREKVRAMVIDLRSNGGGLLPEATLSTGLFIKDGPVVQIRDAVGNVLPQFDEDDGIDFDGPLVVLINRLSASSSEIMAAALRDYGRAVIVGDTSFGKGTVQQNRPLARVYDFSNADLGSIHYTIAKFYRVSGLSTQLKGVSPDIAFPPLVDDSEFGERSEPNALAWDKIAPSDYKGFLNIDAYVNDLTRMHEERIKDDVAFKIMKEDMDRYLKLKAEKTLSVNLAERRKMQQEDEKYRLNAVNERLKSIGKKPIKDIKDLPEDFEFPDALLDEAAAIANDFASLVDQKRYLARTTPIFTRFSVASVAEDHKASSGADRQ
ncbi:carboxy terminal-processing peptidase [Succinatimonas hippei]|uniref:carboxy terminal-processing peptidase n=1 Tax=Succinatimonas hippei TaxID=626938 RepID=UPI0026F0A344|nr:carboxy terminal-processing peptidase [Succinatimonas hippei]